MSGHLLKIKDISAASVGNVPTAPATSCLFEDAYPGEQPEQNIDSSHEVSSTTDFDRPTVFKRSELR